MTHTPLLDFKIRHLNLRGQRRLDFELWQQIRLLDVLLGCLFGLAFDLRLRSDFDLGGLFFVDDPSLLRHDLFPHDNDFLRRLLERVHLVELVEFICLCLLNRLLLHNNLLFLGLLLDDNSLLIVVALLFSRLLLA